MANDKVEITLTPAQAQALEALNCPDGSNMQCVLVGYDEDGNPIVSCICVPTGDSTGNGTGTA